MTEPTTQSAAVELKACPFCGGDAHLKWHGEVINWAGSAYVACFACGSSTTVCDDRCEAIAAWNTRAPIPADPDRAIAIGRQMDADEEDVAIWSGEHRAYWRRGSRGEGANYTLSLDEAGVWTRAEALRLTSHCGPEKLIALHVRPKLTAIRSTDRGDV